MKFLVSSALRKNVLLNIFVIAPLFLHFHLLPFHVSSFLIPFKSAYFLRFFSSHEMLALVNFIIKKKILSMIAVIAPFYLVVFCPRFRNNTVKSFSFEFIFTFSLPFRNIPSFCFFLEMAFNKMNE